MRRRLQIRKQWHPVLIEGLEYLFRTQVEILPEYPVVKLPVKLDTLLKKRDPSAELPFPYAHLGAETLVELRTPGEYAHWPGLCKLLGEKLLYASVQNLEPGADIAGWLVASHVSQAFLDLVARALGHVEEVGPGVWRATHMLQPLVLVNLHRLPLTVVTLPLLMVYKGQREQEIVAFALDHAGEYGLFLKQAVTFHPKALAEVVMVNTKYADAYRSLADLRGIIDLFGEEQVIREIGEEKIIRKIGEEKIIREIGEEKIIRGIGEERVVDDLLKALGPEELQALLDRKIREREGRP